jgi:ABC-type polar amino acid transport system ATPase subunit
MVFQQFNLFPHLTILQNLTLAPRKVRGIGRQEAEETAMRYLKRVRIAEQAHKYPSQLSGGQQRGGDRPLAVLGAEGHAVHDGRPPPSIPK